MKRIVSTLLVGWALAAAAGAESHVRVILDVSGSMKGNDPQKRVVLATLLLHDLAHPNTTLGDTFKVLPFDTREKTAAGTWEWTDPAQPIPRSTRDWIVARSGRRQEFVHRLGKQEYDSIKTFFYPCIRRAIDDLTQASQQKDDVRVIVLVTDGVPEPATRDREAQLIRQDLLPVLEEKGIRLYILAFSNEAFNNKDFLDGMLKGPSGGALGALFVDPKGDKILAGMVRIFGASFGYSEDPPQNLPGVNRLNLEKDVTPERVAVVVQTGREMPPQRLELKPPPGGLVNNPDGMQSAHALGIDRNGKKVVAGSYALRWVLAPDRGEYAFDTDVTQGSVAVLRPSRLALELRPVAPYRVDMAMAETPFPLQVLVRSAGGAKGDPGLVKLSYQAFGPRDSNPDGDRYKWWADKLAAQSDTGKLTPEGRVYEIQVEFPGNQDVPGEVYGGFLEVEARRGEALVGSLVAEFAHRVEVHPRLSIVPLPSSAVSPTALEKGEKYCADLVFEINHGNLPHPDKPDYGVRAVVVPDDAAVVGQELREATFLLDDHILQYEGQPGQQPGDWYKGKTFKPEELLGAHQVCTTIGKPTRGDPAQPVELKLQFTLQDAPYDEFGAIEPFELRLLIAPPSFLEKWSGWLLAALTLLLVLLALWYLRDRPAFPKDLGYAVSREDAVSPLEPTPLPEGSRLAWLLGRVVERPIEMPGEGRRLGRVRPVNDELYSFRLPRGVSIEAVDPGTPLEDSSKKRWRNLAVRKTYRLKVGQNAYLFRMEYR